MSRQKVSPFVRAMALQELKGIWRVEPFRLEGLAEQAHAEASLLYPFADSDILAQGHGYATVAEHNVGCGLAGLHPDILLIRATDDPLAWNVTVLHELAHALLRKHHPRHTHADVWALTLMLAVPRSAYRHIDHADHVAGWVLELRRKTARAVSCAA